MITFSVFCIALLSTTAAALNCSQIPDSYIYAGNVFWYPNNSSNYVTIPPNFNCNYIIKAPITSSELLHGYVVLWNLMKGVNDYIIVTDSLGAKQTLKSRSDSYLTYDVFPGKEMSIQVVTKSVNMGSQFNFKVAYSKVKVGPTTAMKTGGLMNFVNLEYIRGSDPQLPNAVMIRGNEPISVSLATSRYMYPTDLLYNTFVIDGDFWNQTAVYRLLSLEGTAPLVTTGNDVTIVTFFNETYDACAVVLNPKSEADNFSYLTSQASVNGEIDKISFAPLDQRQAVEVVAVQNTKIIMDSLVFDTNVGPWCIAKVVSGPPNNSSQLLLDLSKAQGMMPYVFEMQYFTVIAEECSFSFTVTSNNL